MSMLSTQIDNKINVVCNDRHVLNSHLNDKNEGRNRNNSKKQN